MRTLAICAILLVAGCSDQGKDAPPPAEKPKDKAEAPAAPALPDLTIAPNQVRTITPAEKEMVIGKLVMGDNARIVFDPAVDKWTLKAEQASFGTGATIDGTGRTGESGPDAATPQPIARRCEAGIAGTKGAPGQKGARGVDMTLSFGVTGPGKLQLIASGGPGGRGGVGQPGQQGGPLECGSNPFKNNGCDPGAGGRGGDGGPGGPGGDGGTISIRYWWAGVGPEPAGLDAISFVSKGGPGGTGGAAGVGGRSGRSESCGPRTPRPSPNGAAGAIPKQAQPGKDGVIDVQEIPRPAP